jgi:hypothetical protein
MVGKCVLCSKENVELFPFYSHQYCEQCKLEREDREEYLDNVEDPWIEDAMALDDDGDPFGCDNDRYCRCEFCS